MKTTTTSRKTTGPRTGSQDSAASLLARIDELEKRLARLESERASAPAAPVAAQAEQPAPAATAPAPAAPEPAPAEEISAEILLVISAAVAAFLGERAHVRQVRLLTSDAWAQQGRVSVMASHLWAGRSND